MNKGIQNLAADPYFGKESNDQQNSNRDRNYSMVESELQKQMIFERVEKNPKNFSPYEFDALYKIVLIGDSSTGKTSMLLRFADNVFTGDNYLCTIGVDFKIKTLKVDNKVVKMQVWDTAGQERFRSISLAYYRNSHGCIAVYDISNRASFDSIEEQIQSFISSSASDSSKNIILVGNKTDLEGKRKVSFEEAVRLGKKLNLAGVFETSAKENNSIEDVFFRAIVNCVDYFQSQGLNLSGLNSSSSRSRVYSDQNAQLEKRNSLHQYIQGGGGSGNQDQGYQKKVKGQGQDSRDQVINRIHRQMSVDERKPNQSQQQVQLQQMQMAYRLNNNAVKLQTNPNNNGIQSGRASGNQNKSDCCF